MFVTDNSWCTEESPGRKADWLLVKRLLLSKYLKSELNITFSKILEQIGSNDTGWYWSGLTWQAALTKAEVKLELFADTDML